MRRPTPVLVAALTALATLVPTAAADAAREGPPATVTLAGSLQDELGCPADWTPDCAASGLTRQDDGTWALEADLPAGSRTPSR